MGRPLTVFLPVPGDRGRSSELLLAPPEAWLPEGSVRGGPDVWWVPLRGAGLHRSVACTVGTPWQTREGTWRSLRWEPVAEEGDVAPFERVLPSFTGELGMVQDHGGPPSLVLTGSYDVPASRIGEMADAALLGRIAHRTATRFLARISAALDDRQSVSA